jgi:hypothetical protein
LFASLDGLRLPYHRSQTGSVDYGAKWWKLKTKSTYAWGQRLDGSIPWVGFVGYQVRYDGTIRVRESSIQKELRKQRLELKTLLKRMRKRSGPVFLWRPGIRRHSASIVFRFQQRLLSMSVGTTELWRPPQLEGGCWVSGFRLMQRHKSDVSGLQRLDAQRGHLVQKLKRILTSLPPRSASVSVVRPKRRMYYGPPFSYARALRHNGVLHPIEADNLRVAGRSAFMLRLRFHFWLFFDEPARQARKLLMEAASFLPNVFRRAVKRHVIARR